MALTDILLLVVLALAGLTLALLLRRGRAGDVLAAGLDRAERAVREESAQNRRELAESLKQANDSLIRSVGEISTVQRDRLAVFAEELGRLTTATEQRLETLRQAVETRLQQIQEDNRRQLEQMRQTVDEKLQGTLERRLGESFKLVSERLEMVQRGLGEMRELANGVGDLKRVLTNVKTRGIWGEIQLGALLEQVLSPEQYGTNVATKPGSGERVEFAIRLPGRDGQEGQVVWLPLDAKFPREEYERLLDAQERADPARAEECGRRLEEQVKRFARDIRDKYVSPPHTTDFAVLFLPVEGLYAEVIRRPGLAETLQRDCRVVVAGPTTLAALLNALQMGFRTLAIQKRSSEVWKLLGAVKTEFARFAEHLEAVRKRLHQATDSIEEAARKSRAIERRLRQVQELPTGEARLLLETEEAPPPLAAGDGTSAGPGTEEAGT